MSAADEAYDRLHGVDGHVQAATARESRWQAVARRVLGDERYESALSGGTISPETFADALDWPPADAAPPSPLEAKDEVHRLMMLALHGDTETLREELAALVEVKGCPCGHGWHLHDPEAVPPLCMVCGDATQCAALRERVDRP